ncbi:hypothetical protein HSX11_17875 [Oxalobacteraceae bacterium]|nr:hypothetical protein [Oxalobacteraceae bacterium]
MYKAHSAFNNTFNDEDFAGASYLSNIVKAIGGLLAAVFAVQPVTAATPQADLSVSHAYLSRMANDYEHIAPNLSAELRFMASRG